MTYFLDTNTCIFYLKGSSEQISRRLRALPPANVKIPSMVKGELLVGAEKSRNRDTSLVVVHEFIDALEVVPFCSKAAEEYALVRAGLEKHGKPIGPADLVIAATVLAHGGTLVTNNTREFSRIPGLKLEDWK